MKEKRDCKIIQDLLPNYIDNLTNQETNQFLKNHLNECNDCKKILENMKKELTLDTPKKDHREIKYIKKFRNHLRTLQAILLIILLTFIIITGKKTTILMNLKEKATSYSNSTNYYMKTSNYSSSNMIVETYRKNEQFKTLYASHTTHFYKNGIHNIYYPSYDANFNEILVANLNSSQEFYPQKPYNCFSQTSFFDLLQVAATSSISSELCNGKECYRISFREYSHMAEGSTSVPSYEDDLSGCIIYLNKTTGLPIRIIRPAGRLEEYDPVKDYGSDGIVDYYYSFDTVTDNPFVEPDASQYTLEEDFLKNILKNGED